MNIQNTIKDVQSCRICADQLPLGPRPVFQFGENARILVAGQAPGRRVHETGIPFNDPSGDRLRQWMGIDRDIFYNPDHIAILPMGFCYPGTGKSGDMPPRPECAAKWRKLLLSMMPDIRLTLVIGQYALKWHLPDADETNLTETVKNWRNYYKRGLIPLPHPSPRNNLWLKKNPWFEGDVLPTLRSAIRGYLEE